MAEKIYIKTGLVIKKKEQMFLNEHFLWDFVKKVDAYVFILDLNNFSIILKYLYDLDKRASYEIYCVYPVMIVNGEKLFGKPIIKDRNGHFEFVEQGG